MIRFQNRRVGFSRMAQMRSSAKAATFSAVVAAFGLAFAADFSMRIEEKGNLRIVTVSSASEKGRIELPTPFPNIVRASEGIGGALIEWSFDADASHISLHGPLYSTGPFHLITAEESGRQDDGLIVLSALDATVKGALAEIEGAVAKLENHPGNLRIGFWANEEDFVSWDLSDLVIEAGEYEVELVYSRSGSPDGEATVTINATSIPVPLKPTGSWYIYQVHPLGTFSLAAADSLQVDVKSTKHDGAVMNLKAVLLHPAN